MNKNMQDEVWKRNGNIYNRNKVQDSVAASSK